MPTVRYRFDLTRPHTHLIDVTMETPAHAEAHLDLVLPAWLPGAYKIFDNARNVRALSAEGPDGTALRVERMDWQTWRVFDGGAGATVRYGVFCNKPEIHQGQLNVHHAFLNPGVLALYVDGHKTDWDVALAVALPPGWKVATGLKAEGPDRFSAVDYEEFIDCPLQCGRFAEARFSLDGIEYQVVYEGETAFDPGVWTASLKRIVLAASEFWGKPPLERYVFMYLETGADFLNGLEHRNSTIITGPVTDPARHDGLMGITCHEFFHLWNVKRLRPVGLGPFDYTREAHTTGLWVVEGFTEYYTDLLVLRAGLNRPEGYLAGVASYVHQLEAMPGRANMSLEEASWTTWHFGDDRWNGALNYYVKGYLLGVALDLTLRGRSANRVSLDDVMRAMWEEYGAQDRPYEPIAFCRKAEALLGESLEAFWQRYLHGREDFAWDEILPLAGLQLLSGEPSPVLHVAVAPKDGMLLIENLRAGGAAQSAGLQDGDLLVAIEDRRATAGLLANLGVYFEAGETVTVTYFRRDRLCQAAVKLGAERHYHIFPEQGASAEALAVRSSWLASMGSRAGTRA